MKKLFLPTIFALLLCFIGEAQTLPFKAITVDIGPKPTHVNTILKDATGFMWLGAQDGLYRFDGYEMRRFGEQENSTSLPATYIWCLYEDTQSQLWLGTFGAGLTRYDARTEHFYNYRLPTDDAASQSIRSIHEDKEGQIWLGTEAGLWQFDQKTEVFTAFNNDTTGNQLTNIKSIATLNTDTLLIGAEEGLFFLSLNHLTLQNTGLSQHPVSTIIVADNEIWAGTHRGILEIDWHLALKKQHVLQQPMDENPLSNVVSSLWLDENKNIWAGTLNGLFHADKAQVNLHWQAYGSSDNQGLPDHQINSIYPIEPGLMWAATRQGVVSFSNAPVVFKTLNQDQLGNDLCANVILGSLDDGQGNWWLGTREGLAKISYTLMNDNKFPVFSETNCFRSPRVPEMSSPYIINMRQLGDELWATFWHDGLARLTISENNELSLHRISGFDKLTNSAGIHDIVKDKKGHYWIATPNKGIIEWNPFTDTLITHEPVEKGLTSPYIFHLLIDHQDRLWAGTANGGLCVIDHKAGTTECFLHQPGQTNSLSNNLVLSLFEDSKNRLWACTASGLNLWLGNGKFQRFTTTDGLPNEVIYGILEDDQNRLWVSTNGGLAQLQQTENDWKIQSFDVNDGLQSNEFNQYAFFKTTTGLLCFGGPNGLNYFDPSAIQAYHHTPEVVLADFQLFNQSQKVGKGLHHAINETAQLELAYHQNYLSFTFAALGYTQSEQNEYAYQLIGIDHDWIMAGKRRFASYPNLQPGKYTFHVKAANHDGVWSQNVKSILIHIRAPWWQQWWAYLLYAMILGALIWGSFRIKIQSVRRIAQAKQEERERFRKNTARDFHDEAGNKITKMALLTELIKRQSSGKSTPQLLQLENHIQNLRAGMRDFIWVLDPENDNLYDTLSRLKIFGQDLFQFVDTALFFPVIHEEWQQVSLSGPTRRHLLLLFKEALHNVLKHAQATTAVFEFKQTPDELYFTLKDDGVGIPNFISGGNGMNNMKDRARQMKGNLTVSNPASGGTQITLRIPNA